MTMKNFFITLTIVMLMFCLTSCFKLKPKMVEEIKIGMTTEQLFDIVPYSKDDWHDCEDGVYRYGWVFRAPDGYKRTLWVDIENDKVINLFTI